MPPTPLFVRIPGALIFDAEELEPTDEELGWNDEPFNPEREATNQETDNGFEDR